MRINPLLRKTGKSMRGYRVRAGGFFSGAQQKPFPHLLVKYLHRLGGVSFLRAPSVTIR